MEVRRVRLESTASDLAFRTAGSFEKLGFQEGSHILTKFAQQTEIPDEIITPEEITPDLDEAPIEEKPSGPAGAMESAKGLNNAW